MRGAQRARETVLVRCGAKGWAPPDAAWWRARVVYVCAYHGEHDDGGGWRAVLRQLRHLHGRVRSAQRIAQPNQVAVLANKARRLSLRRKQQPCEVRVDADRDLYAHERGKDDLEEKLFGGGAPRSGQRALRRRSAGVS